MNGQLSTSLLEVDAELGDISDAESGVRDDDGGVGVFESVVNLTDGLFLLS